MKTTLLVCLFGLLAGLPAYLWYWNLFRPVLLKRLKYRLFQARDELRVLLISGEIGERERAYPLVEMICNKSIARIEQIDLTILFFGKADKRTTLEVRRDLELIFNAGPAVRKRFLEIMATMVGAACANSPGILLLGSPVFVFSVTAFWFNKVKSWFYYLVTRSIGNLYFQPA
jgi:uncharacterized membrane protein YccC